MAEIHTKTQRTVSFLHAKIELSPNLDYDFQLTKRELVLCDRSGTSIKLTLWGKQAEQYNPGEDHPVIAFKGVKVGDYQGQTGLFSSIVAGAYSRQAVLYPCSARAR